MASSSVSIDETELVSIALGATGVVASWLYKSVVNRISELEDEGHKLRDECGKLSDRINHNEVITANNYVKNDRFDKMEALLFAKLDRIEAKLDRKVDKP